MTVILLCFLLSVAGVLLVQRLAVPLGLMDAPNQRSSHHTPTPRAGGLGLLAALIFLGLSGYFPAHLWLPAGLVALSGLYDDIRNLKPVPKLLCQLAAAIFLLTGLPVSDFSLPVLLWLGFALLFLVGTTNITNFMDGINGLAAVTGIIAFAGLAVFGILTQAAPTLVVANLAMLAACAGFLPFNFPRARVFMGDTGSLLLGFLLGGQIIWLSRTPADFLGLISLLFPFYADGLTTLFLRWRAGEPLTEAHRRHLYQVLCNELAQPHGPVTLGYAGVQLAVIGPMLIFYRLGWGWQLGWLLGCTGLFMGVSLYIRQRIHNEAQ